MNNDTTFKKDYTTTPSLQLLHNDDLKAIARKLAGVSLRRIHNSGLESVKSLVKSKNIKFPSGSNNLVIAKKLQSERWWFRQLKRENAQAFEHNQIINGFVGGNSPYVSNITLAADKQARINSIEAMKSQMIVNNHSGEIRSLYEVQKHTVSNPAIRRTELMVRINGTEEEANKLGLVAKCYTITTPSRFHAKSGGQANSKYNQSRPARAQKYLTELWSRMRSAFQRAGVNPIGFRVAEPHKDATPHWHMLLWAKPEEIELVTEIMRRYALKDNPNERGAKKGRFNVLDIDPKLGSAVGYIAKYISKNIDGYGLDSGEDTAANRVVAWASLWEVRQFQQIGCPSVSVWRYLRTLEEEQTGLIEEMRQAAITNNYAKYIELQGGLLVTTQDQNVRIASRKKVHDDGTEEVNSYGECLYENYGLKTEKKVYQLSEKKWSRIDLPNDSQAKQDAGFDPSSVAPWSPLNNCIFLDGFDISESLQDAGLFVSKGVINTTRVDLKVSLDVSDPLKGKWIAERVPMLA